MKHHLTVGFCYFQRVLIFAFLISGIHSFDDYFYGNEGNIPYGYSNMNSEWSNQYPNFDYNDDYGAGAGHVLDDIGQSIIDVMKSAMDTTKAATANDVKNGNILNGMSGLPKLLHINSNSTIEGTINSTNTSISALSGNNSTIKNDTNSQRDEKSTVEGNDQEKGNLQNSRKESNQSDLTLPIYTKVSPLGTIILQQNTLEGITQAYNKTRDAYTGSVSNVHKETNTNYPEVSDMKIEPLINIPVTNSTNLLKGDEKNSTMNLSPSDTTRSSEPAINQQVPQVSNMSLASADQNLESTFVNNIT